MDENIMKDLGMVTAYAYALSKGYTGTEDEFAELMASYADVGQTAVDAALRAKASEEAAKASETASKASELAASTSASSASTSETNASQSASVASTKASEAASSASEASSAASTATTKASEASQSASSASGSATAAQTAKTGAEAAQEAAETAETHAKASETAAASSATSASNSATTASTKASEAAQSATSAGTSATNAANSATSASGSASTATTKASQASQSATEAANSATAAGTAKTDAEAAKTAAQTAQTAAETAQGKAEAAQTAAETAQGAAEDAAESVAGKTEQIDENTEDISLLKSHLNATEIVDTASGAIATFPDGSDGVPVESLTVSMEPIQDLHGQDAPYPEGGGKNLLPMNIDTIKSLNTSGAWNDNSYSLNGVVFTVLMDEAENINGIRANGTATENAIFNVGRWTGIGEKVTITGCPSGGSTSTYRIFWDNGGSETGQGIQPTPSEGVTVTGRVYIYGGYTASNMLFKPMICLATATDPTVFAPYSNICPISGRQSVTVTRAGVNLFDKNGDSIINGYFANNAIEASASRRIAYIPCKPNTAYTASKIKSINNDRLAIGYTEETPIVGSAVYGIVNLSSGTTGSKVSVTTTTGSTAKYIVVWYSWDATALQSDNDTLQIEDSSSASDYEPYNGQQITVQLGQTVYGGTVDVTTGEMVVDRAMMDATTLTWVKPASNTNPNGTYFAATGVTVPFYGWASGGRDYAISNALTKASANGVETSEAVNSFWWNTARTGYRCIWGSPNGGSTIEEFLAFIQQNSVVFVGKLAQPLTITLTPEQLTTVLGQNNVWSDGGDVSVDYVADTKLYIEQLTEPDADMVADANITSGQYFMVGNGLYLATANIASGGTISPGVNCTRTSLADALNAINA